MPTIEEKKADAAALVAQVNRTHPGALDRITAMKHNVRCNYKNTTAICGFVYVGGTHCSRPLGQCPHHMEDSGHAE